MTRRTMFGVFALPVGNRPAQQLQHGSQTVWSRPGSRRQDKVNQGGTIVLNDKTVTLEQVNSVGLDGSPEPSR